MNDKLGKMEEKFADIIWREEPISSGELVKICTVELNWKKSTTYTMLKRLCKRGIAVNENGTVRTLVSKESYISNQSKNFIDEIFNGSLPRFLTAFTKRNKLTENDIKELQSLIDKYKE